MSINIHCRQVLSPQVIQKTTGEWIENYNHNTHFDDFF